MQFGNDSNMIRIRPTFSGQKAICPLCNGTLIGKCGEIYVKHWQHHQSRNCDPWKEHETPWHRMWKAKFPDHWQEIIIEYKSEKHIADIKTPAGLVIEFQNSFISSSTINVREKFYENMVWVVNAKTFKSNLKLRSMVNSVLRTIDQDSKQELTLLNDAYEKNLKSTAREIEIIEKESNFKYDSLKFTHMKLDKLNELLSDKDVFSKSVIDKWCKGQFYWNDFTNDITNSLRSANKSQLYEIQSAINNINAEIIINEQKLFEIYELENFEIDGKQFKFIQYENIPSSSYMRARAISKASRNTFFSEIIEFKSESEFQYYLYRKERFDFLIDPSKAIKLYNQKLEEQRKSLVSLIESLDSLKIKIHEDIVLGLKAKIQVLKSDIEKLDNEWDDLLSQKSDLIIKQASIIAEKEIFELELKPELERIRNTLRFNAMKEKKGLYYFYWKHERPSWKTAECPVFFDTADGYLFEKIGDNVFRKIEYNVFIEKYSGTLSF